MGRAAEEAASAFALPASPLSDGPLRLRRLGRLPALRALGGGGFSPAALRRSPPPAPLERLPAPEWFFLGRACSEPPRARAGAQVVRLAGPHPPHPVRLSEGWRGGDGTRALRRMLRKQRPRAKCQPRRGALPPPPWIHTHTHAHTPSEGHHHERIRRASKWSS